MTQVLHSLHFTDGETLWVLEPCSRVHTSQLTRGLLSQSIAQGAHQHGTRSYPYITSASEMFIFQLEISHFEIVVSGTRQVPDKSMVSKSAPGVGKARGRGYLPHQHRLVSSRKGPRKWQEVRFLFKYFFFLILSFKGWWEPAGGASSWTEQTPQGGM